MRNIYLSGVVYLLLNLTSFAQSGADPFVSVQPLPPLAGVGAPFSIVFTIGNSGYAPVSGSNFANKIQFSICLGKCAPSTANPLDAMSGPILNYFDVSFYQPTGTNQGGCFEGIQKQDAVIEPNASYDIQIAAVVTVTSSAIYSDVGASGSVAPNATANPEPQDNNFASAYTYTTDKPHPVSLALFTANVQPDRTVLLNWSTSWERLNKGFTIERSTDLINFEAVGEVRDVAVSSQAVTTYQLRDASPHWGTSYYRLKQTDLDGIDHFYLPVSVILRDDAYGVYPNPVISNQFRVSLDEPQKARITFYNASGHALPLLTGASTNAALQLSSAEKLSPGVYVLTVEERGQNRQYRVVVQ